MAEQGIDNVLVINECPEPPSYYKLFTNNHNISPPEPPISGYATLSEQYDGLVSVQLNNRKTYVKGKDYKNELKALVMKMVESALVLSRSVSATVQSSQLLHQVNLSLIEIYDCLSEYRHHALKENLIDDCRMQLDSIKQLESSLIDIINQYSDIV